MAFLVLPIPGSVARHPGLRLHGVWKETRESLVCQVNLQQVIPRGGPEESLKLRGYLCEVYRPLFASLTGCDALTDGADGDGEGVCVDTAKKKCLGFAMRAFDGAGIVNEEATLVTHYPIRHDACGFLDPSTRYPVLHRSKLQ